MEKNENQTAIFQFALKFNTKRIKVDLKRTLLFSKRLFQNSFCVEIFEQSIGIFHFNIFNVAMAPGDGSHIVENAAVPFPTIR